MANSLFHFTAARALELLNFALLNNKPIRVMYSNRDPSSRRSGSANIFIKVLDHLAVSLVFHCHPSLVSNIPHLFSRILTRQ